MPSIMAISAGRFANRPYEAICGVLAEPQWASI
jgi:hypothetical protein